MICFPREVLTLTHTTYIIDFAPQTGERIKDPTGRVATLQRAATTPNRRLVDSWTARAPSRSGATLGSPPLTLRGLESAREN